MTPAPRSSNTNGPTAKRLYNYDPELVPILSALPVPDYSDVAAVRASAQGILKAMAAGIDVSALNVTDRVIPGPKEAPELSIRIYTPKQINGLVPGLLFMHGGAYVLGDLDSEHASAARYATQLGIAVVSVDYRLAPENPFPAGLEDCYAALMWMHNNAPELNVDANFIGIAGGSAGGGLAAALALLNRDRGGPNICYQHLVVPELDDRLQTESARVYVDTAMNARSAMEWSWKYYLGPNIMPGSAEVSPYAAPARATNLSGLPPALISVEEFDPLRDEGIIYALRLLQADVSVELHAYPGTFHGSVGVVPTAAISQREMTDSLAAMRRGLHLPSIATTPRPIAGSNTTGEKHTGLDINLTIGDLMCNPDTHKVLQKWIPDVITAKSWLEHNKR